MPTNENDATQNDPQSKNNQPVGPSVPPEEILTEGSSTPIIDNSQTNEADSINEINKPGEKDNAQSIDQEITNGAETEIITESEDQDNQSLPESKIDTDDITEDESDEESATEITMQLNEDLIGDKQKHWYVINTYSGYEDNVRQALKQRIDSMDMTHKIFDVIVPKEKKVEIRNGKKKIVEKKIFPGYVLVQMIVDEDSWYVVRNTPNVTGFIGFGSKPTPLSDEEVKKIQKRMGVDEPEYKIDYLVGESVKIVDGPFKDFDGVIAEIDKIRGKIKVLVSMFGRETPVELDALQITRL